MTPSAAAIAQASSIASSSTPRQARSSSSDPSGRCEYAVAAARTASRAALSQSTAFSLSPISTSNAAAFEQRRGSLELLVRQVVRGDRDERGEALLDDLHAPHPVRLEAGDRPGGDPRPEPLAHDVQVLEPVEERDHDRVLDRCRVDLVESLLELVRLHGDEQDRAPAA